MFPLLFEIPIFGGLKIYTYGVLVATAFVLGILWTTREAKLAGVKTDFILDLSFYIIIAALAGSRLLYILIDWRRYVAHPLDALKIWEGGLVFYGGLIGALVVSLAYIRKHGYPFLKIADLFMPGVALGHAIGRLGCFAAGCCYGRETHGWFAVVFPTNLHSLAPAGVPLIPSQLLEAVVEFLIFLILSRFAPAKPVASPQTQGEIFSPRTPHRVTSPQNAEKLHRKNLIAFRRKKSFEGQVFLVYLILYSISRSILEVFRGDSVRGFIVPNVLSTSQAISGGLVILAIAIYWRLKRRTRLSPGGPL